MKDSRIGRGTYGTAHVLRWGDDGALTIGAYCSIAAGVTILLGGEHRTDFVSAYPFSTLMPAASHLPTVRATKGNVRIGNDVWIGLDATILSGVTVGDGAIIGARAVVASDVAPYAVVVGNPARQIRVRFTPEQVGALLRIAWWEWPESQIEVAWPLLLSPDVGAFIERYGK